MSIDARIKKLMDEKIYVAIRLNNGDVQLWINLGQGIIQYVDAQHIITAIDNAIDIDDLSGP